MNKIIDRKYSASSYSKLITCDSRLIFLFTTAIYYTPHDMSILCGYRGKDDQNKAYESGNSKLLYPDSMHNKTPSLAIDIVPYPINWKDIERFNENATVIKQIAYTYGIGIKWFGDGGWDYPHWQLCMDDEG